MLHKEVANATNAAPLIFHCNMLAGLQLFHNFFFDDLDMLPVAINRLIAIDANWHQAHTCYERWLMPIGVSKLSAIIFS